MKDLIKILQVLQTKCNAHKCNIEKAGWQLYIDELWNIVSGEEASLKDVHDAVRGLSQYVEPEDTAIFWNAVSKAKVTRQ